MANPDPTIRVAASQDLGTIAALEKDWEREGSTIGFQAGGVASFSNYIDATDQAIWVAECAKEVVAYISVTVHRTSKLAVVPHDAPYLDIDDLYVSPEHRSRSLGAQLVDAAIEFARTRGVQYAAVFTSSSRVADIMRFYASQGFEPWGIQFFREV